MAWMKELGEPTRHALILVPRQAAMVQDLGPFRSGRLLETDILPGSALVCPSEDGMPVLDEEGIIRFTFEGNANGAVNLASFHERCLSAAGRLATRAPSIAYGRARPSDIVPVAEMDLLRYVITRVIDSASLEEWSGEKVSDFLPPADLRTPTSRPEDTNPLCKLPMRSLAQGARGVFAWLLMDGTILTKGEDDSRPLTAWRPGDPGLDGILEAAGLDLSKRLTLAA